MVAGGWPGESADPRGGTKHLPDEHPSPPPVRTCDTVELLQAKLVGFLGILPPGLAGACPRAAVTTSPLRSLLPVVSHFGTCVPVVSLVLLLEHVVSLCLFFFCGFILKPSGLIPPFDRTLSWSLSTPCPKPETLNPKGSAPGF